MGMRPSGEGGSDVGKQRGQQDDDEQTLQGVTHKSWRGDRPADSCTLPPFGKS